jgi:hypothetical protein
VAILVRAPGRKDNRAGPERANLEMPIIPLPTLGELTFQVTLGLALLLGAGLAAVIPRTRTGFGPYEPQTAMRIIVPSVVMLALSAQTIVSSFLLSLLGMKRT